MAIGFLRFRRHKTVKAAFLFSIISIFSVYFQNCTPVGDASGVGSTGSAAGTTPSCVGTAPPRLTGGPGNQTATAGLGTLSGTRMPQNLRVGLTLGYATQAVNFNCTVTGMEGLDVDCNSATDIDLVQAQECIPGDTTGSTGTATVNIRARDPLCNLNSNTISFQVTVTNTCPKEFPIPNPDPQRNDSFGTQVAISGNYAVVLASKDNDGATNGGAAYVYHWNNTLWEKVAKLMPGTLAVNSEIQSAAISGNIIVLGAPYHGNHGTVFVFRNNGTGWVESAALTPAQTNTAVYTMDFGYDVDIDGSTLVVGAPGYDHNNNGVSTGLARAGAVFVYSDVGGNFQALRTLAASDRAAGDFFGAEVAVSGQNVAVGAPLSPTADKSTAPGKAYVFSGATETKLQAGAEIQNGSQFGSSVDISGTKAVVGAKTANGAEAGSGAAFIFDGGAGWAKQAKISGPDSQDGDWFGAAVALNGTNLVVGAPYANIDPTTKSGAAYYYVNSGATWTHRFKFIPRGANRGTSDYFGESVDIGNGFFLGGARLDDEGELNTGSVFFIRAP
jgi:hypothetical protein